MVDQLGNLDSLQEAESNQIKLQVLELQPNGSKYKCKVSDGTRQMNAVLASQVTKLVTEEGWTNKAIICVKEHMLNSVNGVDTVMIIDAELVSPGEVASEKEEAQSEQPAVNKDSASKPIKDEKLNSVTPGPSKIPKLANTPFHTPNDGAQAQIKNDSVTTAGKLKVASTNKASTPIQALNPYNNQFTIKAKVAQKYPKKSITTRTGESKSLFTVELVDEQGTAIEATLWGELADKYYEVLELGKVYFFTKGRVKPANKMYSGVKNDYAIDFSVGTEIEECADQTMAVVESKLDFVRIDQLAAHIGKRVPVDLLGVVTNVQPVGSVKRRTDAADIVRREITMVDDSCKSVVVTLWGEVAEQQGAQLEEMMAAESHPIVSIAAVRVSDYNGVSVSTTTRSRVSIGPDVPQAVALKEWYSTTGASAHITLAGEGLMNAIKRDGSGNAQRNERITLKEIVKDKDLPPADAKPEYFNIALTFAAINPEQTMYYMASPEDNRKVIEQNGAYFCEYTGKTYSTMNRRYVMNAQVMDFTGTARVNLFDAEGNCLLGCSADQLHELREATENNGYASALKKAQWTQWMARVQVKTREYQGEARQNLSVQSLVPLDYTAESSRMVDMISKLVDVKSA